jgi:hypothetical protein
MPIESGADGAQWVTALRWRYRVVLASVHLKWNSASGGRGESNHSHLPSGTAVFRATCAANDFTTF